MLNTFIALTHPEVLEAIMESRVKYKILEKEISTPSKHLSFLNECSYCTCVSKYFALHLSQHSFHSPSVAL